MESEEERGGGSDHAYDKTVGEGGDHERKGVFLKATAQQEMQSHSVECACVFVQGELLLAKTRRDTMRRICQGMSQESWSLIGNNRMFFLYRRRDWFDSFSNYSGHVSPHNIRK